MSTLGLMVKKWSPPIYQLLVFFVKYPASKTFWDISWLPPPKSGGSVYYFECHSILRTSFLNKVCLRALHNPQKWAQIFFSWWFRRFRRCHCFTCQFSWWKCSEGDISFILAVEIILRLVDVPIRFLCCDALSWIFIWAAPKFFVHHEWKTDFRLNQIELINFSSRSIRFSFPVDLILVSPHLCFYSFQRSHFCLLSIKLGVVL